MSTQPNETCQIQTQVCRDASGPSVDRFTEASSEMV